MLSTIKKVKLILISKKITSTEVVKIMNNWLCRRFNKYPQTHFPKIKVAANKKRCSIIQTGPKAAVVLARFKLRLDRNKLATDKLSAMLKKKKANAIGKRCFSSPLVARR